jgi:hypothetical protein
MQIIRLMPINNPNGGVIDINTQFTMMPANVTDTYFVKQIKYLERNGYEIFGTKNATTGALISLAKVPPGQHVEVWGP